MKQSEVLGTDLKMFRKTFYPWFFFYRIARLSFVIFLPTLFLILFIYRSSYKEGLVSQITTQIEENLHNTQLTLKTINMSWERWCEQLPDTPETRYTLVNRNGKIICDTKSHKKHLQLEDREEVDGAFEHGFSSQVRFSDIFNAPSVFAGLKTSEDMVVRKVVPITSLKDDLSRFDRVLFLRIVPFAVLSYFLFLYLFYRATQPLGSILSKVESFKIDLPFKKNLKLLYKKNEWARIEEALNEADQKLKVQVIQAKTENEKMTAILESIYDDIIAIDTFESILFYNTNFKNNFIRTRNDQELIPKIWHTFEDEGILNAFRSVLKDGKKISLKGINFPSSNHPERFFDLNITSLKGADEKINGALGVFYDVTELKRTEKMRVDFVANVSHEIRTPLTSVKGYTQILDSHKDKIDVGLHLFLDKIISNTERMISLFNDLLNLSVIESKDMVKFEGLDLLEMVESISDNIKTNYPDKHLQIEHHIDLQKIYGDHRLIEQVLTNLMDNACKYSGSKVVVQVSSFEKNNKAHIIVADKGKGISKEHALRIFERFYRVDSSRETSRGAGLGLSIVKHIIHKHGGRIWVESEEHEGSSFIIELPLEQVL